jgi:uncharacterized membrane protein YqaE (UPF0057 family)
MWRYPLAILLPPAAVASTGARGRQILLNVMFTLWGWLPGIVHAMAIVNRSGGGQGSVDALHNEPPEPGPAETGIPQRRAAALRRWRAGPLGPDADDVRTAYPAMSELASSRYARRRAVRLV